MSTIAARETALPAVGSKATKWVVLVGAIMVQLILGTVYGYSVFWQPLEASIWPPVVVASEAGTAASAEATIVADADAARSEHAARQSRLKYTFAICILSFAGAMVFAGRLQDVRGPRFTAMVGGVILGIGFLIPSQMHHRYSFYICHAVLMTILVLVALSLFDRGFKGKRKSHPILRVLPIGIVLIGVVAGVAVGYYFVSDTVNDRVFLLWATVGLFAGIGIGFAYVCPIAALVKWFPAHKGLMSGIAVAGFGLGAYLFSGKSVFGAVGYINAHGIYAFFSVHALVCFVVVSVGAMLLRDPPAEARASTQAQLSASGADGQRRSLLRSGRFYVVWLMFFSGAMAGLMVIGILKPFAGGQLVAAETAAGVALTEATRGDLLLQGAAAVGVLAVFNALGRVAWGFASDRIGRTTTMIVMFLLQGVTLLLLVTLNTKATLAVGAALVGFNFGGNFALFPSLTADLFGTKSLGANYGWVFTSYGVAGVIGIWMGNMAQQLTGSYFAAFAIAALLCFVSAGLAVGLRRSARAVAAGA